MSKQGNYVTLPGGGVNWAEGLSSSLADLSAGYRDQAENEIAAKESAAKLELMKAQEARAAADAAFTADERKRAADNREAFNKLNLAPDFSMLGSGVQDTIAERKQELAGREAEINRISADIYERRSYITDKGELSKAGQAEFDARLPEYMKMYSDPNVAREKAYGDIVTMRDNAVNNTFGEDARKELALSRKELDNAIDSARYSVTVEEYVAAKQKEAAAAGHHDPYSPEFAQLLRNEAIQTHGLKTRGEVIQAGQAAAEAAYKKEADRIGFLKDYYTSLDKASPSSKGRGVSSTEFADFAKNLDFPVGTGDRDKATDLYQKSVNSEFAKGVPAEFIREAIMLMTVGSIDEETLDPTVEGNIQKVVDLAKALANGSTTGRDVVDKAEFKINEDKVVSYSADELMRRRFDKGALKTAVTPKAVLARPDAAAFDEKVRKGMPALPANAADKLSDPTKFATDKAKRIAGGSDETLSVPEMQQLPPTVRLPANSSVDTKVLKEVLGDTLDEGNAGAESTDTNKVSRSILYTQTAIDNLNKQLADEDVPDEQKKVIREKLLPRLYDDRQLQRLQLDSLSGKYKRASEPTPSSMPPLMENADKILRERAILNRVYDTTDGGPDRFTREEILQQLRKRYNIPQVAPSIDQAAVLPKPSQPVVNSPNDDVLRKIYNTINNTGTDRYTLEELRQRARKR